MEKIVRYAVYSDLGKIVFENGDVLLCEQLNLPYGSDVCISIEFSKSDYLTGKENYVWATYSLEQAEIVAGALKAQNIAVVLENQTVGRLKLFLLKVVNEIDVEKASAFIWKSEEGLNLKPDWFYPRGSENKSFERWLKNG